MTILDIQSLIRRLPKPVIAMVHGYAVGGGQVLQMICDLSIAAENAVFGHAGPRVGSIDGGYGIGLLAQTIGQRRAREMWYLCRKYSAQEALSMGLINAVVPADEVEQEALRMADEMLSLPPTTLRLMKTAFNALDDGLAGMQQFAGEATHAYYMTAESKEAHAAYRERRTPNFAQTAGQAT
jgi:naphthoate synthase